MPNAGSQKIMEWKNLDWLKGISAQPNVPMGGLVKQLAGCDPFEQGGLALPSQTAVGKSMSVTPKALRNFNSGGNNYVYAQSDAKLFQVLTASPFTITDVTSQIFQQTTGTPTTFLNSIIYQNAYVYAEQMNSGTIQISANSLPVNSANDVLLKNGVDGSNNVDFMPMSEGPDGNLYCGNAAVIEEITSVSGTTGNSSHFFIDTGFTIRDIKNDGRYLVIIADNNNSYNASRLVGAYKCRIYFWDCVQQSGTGFIIPDAMYEWDDSYAIGMKLIDGGNSISGNTLLLFTNNGIYLCNVASYPRMVRPFPTSSSIYFGRPTNPNQVVTVKGSTYWVDGTLSTSSYIMAYGNPITGQARIFYLPYNKGNELGTCLSVAGNIFILGTNLPELSFHNTGSSRGEVFVQSLDTNMVQPHRYDGTKVVLSQPLSSGQSVEVQVYCQNHTQLMSTETKNYNSANPKQNLLFKPVLTGNNQPSRFEDIDITVISSGAALQRVSTYATPIDDFTEDL